MGAVATQPRGWMPATSALIVALLAAVIFIHALDRGNLATAAPLIKDELKLSNLQIGVLTSAFFWTYAPGHIFAGWVIQRIGGARTLAWGVALWAAATLVSGAASGFAVLLALRLLLGLGESVGFPASSKLLAEHVPVERLGSANALVAAGLMLGNGAGTFLGGVLIARFGWRMLFFVFGAVSLAWLVPWLAMGREASAPGGAPATRRGPEPGFRELLGKRELWAAAIGQFALNYPYFLVLSWLPLYLVKSQGFSLTAMAKLGGSVYLLATAIALMAGRAADVWMGHGASSTKVRKTMVCAGSAVSLACMLACGLGGPRVAIAGLLAFSLAAGLTSFNTYAIGQTLAGPAAAGKWVGVQNGLGGLAGLTGPVITGFIVDRTHSFDLAFLAAALMAALGLVCWGVVIGRVEPLAWAEPAAG